ncbi:hypothetical protein LI328DRAFT_69237 [Trichoderma asperelloides]|nr:hypothetical protein LI328DRAFT_69237 [Trichoderma asperelloides]
MGVLAQHCRIQTRCELAVIYWKICFICHEILVAALVRHPDHRPLEFRVCLISSGTVFGFYSGSRDFALLQVRQLNPAPSSSLTLLLFLFCSVLFFSFTFICDRAFRLITLPAVFCGTLWLPLRRTAATGLTTPGSRLSSFFLAVSLVASRS